MRIVTLICSALIPAASLAAVTYSFDWYCSGCARLGMGTNGREGPFGSGSACEGRAARCRGASPRAGVAPGAASTPSPASHRASPTSPAPPAVSVPRTAVPETAKVPAYVDARPDRVRRADEVRPRKEGPEAISGRWRNGFSWYDVSVSNDTIQIAQVETCRTPDCVRREYPNRPVFLGRLEGNRLVGAVPIRSAIESEQNGRHCGTPAGEFPVEGRLSDDHRSIVWRNAQLPAAEGCAPVSISLGTWRRG